MAVKADLFLCHAECEPDELLQVEDGHIGLTADGITPLGTVHIKLHLAERARRCDEIGLCMRRTCGDLSRDGQHVVLGGELRVEAAAFAPCVKPDGLRTEAAYEPLEGLGIVALLIVHLRFRAQNVAAIVAGDLCPLQRIRDLSVEHLGMLIEHPEEMRDVARPLICIRMSCLLQDGVHLILQPRLVIETVLRRAQLQGAGVADGEDGEPHMLCDGDVACVYGEHGEVVHALPVGCTAARPVWNLLDFNAELFADLLERGICLGCRAVEDAARE